MTNDRIKALEDALRTKAAMIELGEKIAWGSDVALMREAADTLAASRAASDCHQPDLVTADGGQAAQPVAWQRLVDGKWQNCSEFVALGFTGDAQKHDPDVRPLYATPQPVASQPAQPVAVKVKPLVWIATGDAGDFMAYDPLFERQVLSLEPAAYDTERLDRIMAEVDVQPLTVQDAARVPEIAALIEAAEHLLQNYLRDELDEPDLCVDDEHWSAIHGVNAALRAIAEGRA